MKSTPKVGSRWRLGVLTYEIVEGEAYSTGCVPARVVSAVTDQPIGGKVEIPITSLGTTYSQVKKKAGA